MKEQTPSAGPVKTLSIGGATFDLFMKTDSSVIHECGDMKAFALPLGSKIRVTDVAGCGGGGAHNTAVGLSRLGCDAAFSGVVGDDQWGEAIKNGMEKEGVDTRYLTIIEHEASSFSCILNSASGERAILSHKSMDRHFHDVTFDKEEASKVHAIYLNHIHEDTCVIANDIVSILTANPSVCLTWNPGGRQVEAGMLGTDNKDLVALTHVLLLNKEEALAFSGKKTTKEAMHILIRAGAKVVCVTDGSNGSMATDGTTLWKCPTLPCPVVDMTGAGDSFGTAITWAIVTGKDLPTALKAGTINAMSVVGSVGAQAGLLTETQIQTKLQTTELSVSSEPF